MHGNVMIYTNISRNNFKPYKVSISTTQILKNKLKELYISKEKNYIGQINDKFIRLMSCKIKENC